MKFHHTRPTGLPKPANIPIPGSLLGEGGLIYIILGFLLGFLTGQSTGGDDQQA